MFSGMKGGFSLNKGTLSFVKGTLFPSWNHFSSYLAKGGGSLNVVFPKKEKKPL